MAAMTTKSPLALSVLALSIHLFGCSAPPADRDVVGAWIADDGGALNLQEDGTFTAQSLPRKVFFDRRHGDAPVSGSGRWKLQRNKAYWEVSLSFEDATGYPGGYHSSILVNGSGASTALFEWVEDQGGERYTLKRKSDDLDAARTE